MLLYCAGSRFERELRELETLRAQAAIRQPNTVEGVSAPVTV